MYYMAKYEMTAWHNMPTACFLVDTWLTGENPMNNFGKIKARPERRPPATSFPLPQST